MGLEMAKLDKRRVAHRAGVRTLASMHALMGFEVDKLGKRCTADTTGERTLASMRTLMNDNITLIALLIRAEPAPM